MRKSNLFIATGLLIVLFSATYIGMTFYEKQNQSQKSFASITPLIRQIMVVDMNKTGIFTADAVLNGQLPILSIHKRTDTTTDSENINFLDQVGRLIIYDVDHNNRIDNMDPIYSQLELIYINQGQITSTVPIAAAGIREIYLDEAHVTTSELYPNGPKGYWNVINTAILVDGSTRVIRVIGINSSDLPSSAAKIYS